MPTQVENRREDPRSRIPDFQDAEIVFNLADGKEHRFPLVELSVRGGAFRMSSRLPELKPGLAIEIARVRVGKIEIRAHLHVLHVTRTEGNAYICGTRLYAANEEDRNELAGLVSRLETLPE